MSFSPTQRGVIVGMAGGLVLTVGVLLWPQLPLVGSDVEARLELWFACALLSALWLLLSIARLARHRFVTPADIDGGMSDNTRDARVLQAILQNTLEQVVLAVVAYGAWLWFGPSPRHGMVIVFAAFFAAGRLLFLTGYARGAAARSLGFALTFYPSVALCLMSVPYVLARLWPIS